MADRQLASQKSPLEKFKTPVFVSFGFDDNGISGLENTKYKGGLKWVTDLFASYTNPDKGNSATFDGEKAKATFFMSTYYLESPRFDSIDSVKKAWRNLYLQGHEIGIHSHTHPHGAKVNWSEYPVQWTDLINKQGWIDEIQLSRKLLSEFCEIPSKDIKGFRAPFLEYSNESFKAIHELGFSYDSSIEEGWQYEQDLTSQFFPYTLDEGSPVSEMFEDWYINRKKIESYPGLWELPIYCLQVPPDSLCEQYNVKKGLRQRLAQRTSSFSISAGKVNGMDWNLWNDFKVSKEEFVAITTYSFDLHYQVSRVPFILGAHSELYSDEYDSSYNLNFAANYKDRQRAIEELLEYISKKEDSRIVSKAQLVEWMRNPSPLHK